LAYHAVGEQTVNLQAKRYEYNTLPIEGWNWLRKIHRHTMIIIIIWLLWKQENRFISYS